MKEEGLGLSLGAPESGEDGVEGGQDDGGESRDEVELLLERERQGEVHDDDDDDDDGDDETRRNRGFFLQSLHADPRNGFHVGKASFCFQQRLPTEVMRR